MLKNKFAIIDLNQTLQQSLVSFEDAYRIQMETLEKRIRDEIPDTLLIVEHASVYTRGRGLQWNGSERERSLPAPGIAVIDIERGGDLTWHGPGQLVIYPIVKLGASESFAQKDILKYVRTLEEWMIQLLALYGLQGHRKDQASGVWLNDSSLFEQDQPSEKKVAALGVAVRKWVTYHGIALNVNCDLKAFHRISPCGFLPEQVTSMAVQLSGQLSGQLPPQGVSLQKLNIQDVKTNFLEKI